MLDRVLQLANVPGPGPRAQFIQDVDTERVRRHIRQPCLPQKVFGQRRDVLTAVA
jgi:hypothetical protein